MDTDRIKGAAKEFGGKLEEAAGTRGRFYVHDA